MPTKPVFKFRELIQALHGPRNVQQLIEEHGWEAPKIETIEGWLRRDSAPGPWALALVFIAQREGLITTIDRLLREDV